MVLVVVDPMKYYILGLDNRFNVQFHRRKS